MIRLSLILAVSTTIASAAAAQPLPPQAVPRTTEKLPSASASSHIDGALQQLIKDFRTRQAAGQREAAPVSRVPVTIRFRSAENAAAHRSILSAFGAAPVNEYRNVVESYVAVDTIEALAANPEVAAVEWIVPPQPQVIGQGAAVHNASSWQASGHNGAGVKVGIIDVGFIGLTSLIGSELPAGTIGRCYIGLGTFTSSLSACEAGTVHGTAVAEAVTDIAPGVQLYVANPVSALDLRNTVAWMTSQGVRVINHSVGWTWSGPGDGTTPFADSPLNAVNDAVANGAVWANAAGNNALSTWSGAYSDVNGNDWLEFSNVNLGAELNGVNLAAGQQLIAQARWEDSWTAAGRDLDLYLINPSGNFVAGSFATQDGTPGGTPREVLVYTASSAGTYYLAVNRYTGTAPAWVEVQAFSQQALQVSTPAHSIANPAETANPGALAVGAVPWSNTSSIEPFSSRGPTRDGRMKPDLVGADRADSVSYGPGAFAGTSQAAPHVAGLAALVVEAFPAASPKVVADYLRTVAQPRGAPGNVFGAGFAQVPAFPATISLSALLTSTPLPAIAGQSISWMAFAIGGQAPFEYKFWIFSTSNGWAVLQDYSPSNVATWTPLGAGTYEVQVWARRIGSSAAYEDWRDSGPVIITSPPPVSAVSLSANVIFPAPINSTIIWTAAAAGGVQPLQYQFWRFREGTGWSMIRDYSPSNIFIWTPLAGDAGRYQLQVFVRSAGSTAAYDAWAGTTSFDIVVPPVVVTSLTSNVSFPAIVGTPITWAASAVGGATSLQYQFLRYKQGSGWTIVQPYSGATTFSWTPSGSDAGTYAIQVWVRQFGSSATYDAWRGTDLFALNPRPPAVLTSFTRTPAPPTTTGIPISWSATASGGTSPLQYKFWLFSSGAWNVLQDYSLASTVTWTPASAGTYAVQVWVRSAGSTTAYEDWRDSGFFTITDSPTIFISDLSANVPLPATVTQPITWTVTAGGGSGPLSYRFFRYRQSSGWSMVQDYSTNPSYTWTPALGDDGTYAIQVWIRGAGSTAAYDKWRDSGLFRVLPPTVLFMTSKVGDYIGGGTTRLFTPADGNFAITRNFDNGVSIAETHPTYAQWWYLDFAAPGDAELTLGVYPNATRFPFQSATAAGLSVTGEGRGCNESVGRFVVRDVVYAQDGTPTTFAADFEQHCEGWAPALYGSIRVNSTVPVVAVRPLTFSAGSIVPIGAPVVWSAGSATGREYRAWLYRASTRTWMLVHDYSAEPTVTWTPQPGDQGDWVLVMWERAAGTTVEYDTWRVSDVVKVQ
jgi:Subtilase family/Bacterial pre-peptidase C-terminal domain